MVGRVIAALRGFAGRGACTDAERRAAAWLHDDLRARGHEAWVETHWVRPGWAVPVALAALLAVAGSLLSVTVPEAGVALGAVAAVCLAIEAAGRVSPLRMLGARRATQHVLVGAGDAPVTLLVVAAYDVPRTGLVPRLARARGWLALAAAVVAACAAARLAGADGTWLGAIQIVPTVVLLFALAAAVDVALSAWSDGGAGAAAVALAVHEELSREPPASLAPALLLVGAGSSGPQSLRAHLRRDGADPAGTVLLEVAGPPGWRARHPQLRAAGERAAAALGADPRPRGPRPARVRRLPAVRVGGEDEAALDLALGIADALDAQLGSVPGPAGYVAPHA